MSKAPVPATYSLMGMPVREASWACLLHAYASAGGCLELSWTKSIGDRWCCMCALTDQLSSDAQDLHSVMTSNASMNMHTRTNTN